MRMRGAGIPVMLNRNEEHLSMTVGGQQREGGRNLYFSGSGNVDGRSRGKNGFTLGIPSGRSLWRG